MYASVVFYLKAAIVEMYQIQDNTLSSSTEGVCYLACDLRCKNLFHEPTYKWTFHNQFTRYHPNPACLSCFPDFLINGTELLMEICEPNYRHEILCQTFVATLKSSFKDAIRNYRKCLHTHVNCPPDFFCSECFGLFYGDVLLTFHHYHIINFDKITVAACNFFTKFRKTTAQCQHDCVTIIV